VLADAAGAAAALTRQLEAAGGTVIVAEPGADYGFCDGNRCVVNPAVAEHYTRLLADAERRSGGPLRGAVHLWNLDLRDEDQAHAADFERAENLGCVSVLHLVQALARTGGSPRLWLVTRGAQAVGEHEQPVVMQAAVWGMGRVIGHQEHLALWGGLVDLDPAAPAASVEALGRELLQPGREDQVALRAGERYVARLSRDVGLQAAAPVHLRADASYLITGGFGALGLLTARWMVERGARRLILMGRNGVPERSEWQAAGHRADTRARIDAVRELEALGATVVSAAVDVADGESLARYLQQYAREAWPPIRGVVHAAGMVRDQLLLQMDAASFTSVLRPKVRGAWNLHRQLADAPLDFFVLYSSIGSLVAAAGQANYAAGNAFLDALAAYRRRSGRPALSINWGPWAVGMVSELNLVDHYAARGLDVITAKQGMQFLARLMRQPIAQAAVLTANWAKFFEFQPRVNPMLAHLADAAGGAAADGGQQEDFLTALLIADADARAALLGERLRDLVARVMRMDRAKIDLAEPLNVLGLDSMMATELKNRIEVDLHVSVPVMDLLKGIAIGELAAGLLPRLIDENRDLHELLEELEQAAADEARGSLAATA
jgi:NADP-dependent 3-hydroxy acid dehydrogenase YdfG